MARLTSSACPYPVAETAKQREANRAAAALRSSLEQRSLAALRKAPGWLNTLRRARRRDGAMPCLALLAPVAIARRAEPTLLRRERRMRSEASQRVREPFALAG